MDSITEWFNSMIMQGLFHQFLKKFLQMFPACWLYKQIHELCQQNTDATNNFARLSFWFSLMVLLCFVHTTKYKLTSFCHTPDKGLKMQLKRLLPCCAWKKTEYKKAGKYRITPTKEVSFGAYWREFKVTLTFLRFIWVFSFRRRKWNS